MKTFSYTKTNNEIFLHVFTLLTIISYAHNTLYIFRYHKILNVEMLSHYTSTLYTVKHILGSLYIVHIIYILFNYWVNYYTHL